MEENKEPYRQSARSLNTNHIQDKLSSLNKTYLRDKKTLTAFFVFTSLVWIFFGLSFYWLPMITLALFSFLSGIVGFLLLIATLACIGYVLTAKKELKQWTEFSQNNTQECCEYLRIDRELKENIANVEAFITNVHAEMEMNISTKQAELIKLQVELNAKQKLILAVHFPKE